MQILHVTHQYYPAIGGAENYIVDLSEELANRGHLIDVFTTQSKDYHTWHNTLPAKETIKGVNVHRFASIQRREYTWRLLRFAFNNYNFSTQRPRWLEPLVYVGNGPLSFSLFTAILQAARQYDLIHISQLHYAHAYTAFLAARWQGIPIVVSPLLHAEQPQTHALGYLHTILKQSNALLALTRFEQAFMLEQGLNRTIICGGSGLRMERFPPIAKLEARQRLGIAKERFVILFLGRKTEYKGLDIVLQALFSLQENYPDLQFLAFGPETEYSKQLWEKYGERVNVTHRDAVSDQERLDALAACDVLVLPSTTWSLSISARSWASSDSSFAIRFSLLFLLILFPLTLAPVRARFAVR